MYDAESGALLRRYRDGEAAVAGFLDDYAFLTQGLLDLYEAQFDLEHLETARRLTEKQVELFEDTAGGGFFGAEAAPDRVFEMKDDYDGAEPAGNSVAVMNLLRLARMTGEARFRQSAEARAGGFRIAALGYALGLAADAGGLRVPDPANRGKSCSWASVASPDTRALMRALSGSLRPKPGGAAGGFRRDATQAGGWYPRNRSHAPRRWTSERVRLPRLRLPGPRFRARRELAALLQ